MQHLLEAVGAVDAGSLVDGVLDALHAGEEEDHVVAGPAPDQTDDDDDGHVRGHGDQNL